jgi:hypothetical protein
VTRVRLSFVLVERSLRELDNQENRSNAMLGQVERHVGNLKKDNPYSSDRIPFVDAGWSTSGIRHGHSKEKSE